MIRSDAAAPPVRSRRRLRAETLDGLVVALLTIAILAIVVYDLWVAGMNIS
jgi:hypothetical protein